MCLYVKWLEVKGLEVKGLGLGLGLGKGVPTPQVRLGLQAVAKGCSWVRASCFRREDSSVQLCRYIYPGGRCVDSLIESQPVCWPEGPALDQLSSPGLTVEMALPLLTSFHLL